MSSISNHLHVRPWQIATSKNKALPLRCWDQKGTVYKVSALDAAYNINRGKIITSFPGFDGGVIFEFDNGEFVSVKH